MLYPLKFNNIYKTMPWAGRDFELFRTNLPEGIVGESWDVACHNEGINVVINGEYRGKSIDELISRFGKKLLGTKFDSIPIMIRLVNPRDKLSVQVHPTNEYAVNHGMNEGKTEAWYVMEAFDEAFMYVGCNDCTKEEFKRCVHNGTVEKYLNKIPVKKGDFFYIPSGQVHALGRGLVILEIGQNANKTYRLYDYGRGRKLDIESAMDVIDLSIPVKKSREISIEYKSYTKRILCISEFFNCTLFDIKGRTEQASDMESFEVLTCVEGCGTIEFDHGKEYIRCGDSLFIPAILGQYTICGKLKLVKTSVGNIMPQIEKVVFNNDSDSLKPFNYT